MLGEGGPFKIVADQASRITVEFSHLHPQTLPTQGGPPPESSIAQATEITTPGKTKGPGKNSRFTSGSEGFQTQNGGGKKKEEGHHQQLQNVRWFNCRRRTKMSELSREGSGFACTKGGGTVSGKMVSHGAPGRGVVS